MAGNYPSPTVPRLAYHADGTRVWHYSNNTAGVLTEVTATVIGQLNAEDTSLSRITLASNTTTGITTGFLLFQFLEPMDIQGLLMLGNTDNRAFAVAYSNDTTNGIDGTWTSDGSVGLTNLPVRPTYRNSPTGKSGTGWKFMRLTMSDTTNGTAHTYSTNVGKIYLFGKATGGTNRLEIWDATLDQRAAPDLLEWGDRPRNTVQIKSFRIKNMSATMKAVAVRAAMQILTDSAVVGVVGQHALSQDGGTSWAIQQTIGDLAPGAISGEIKIRQTLDPGAELWLWAFVVYAAANTWEVP